MFTQTDYDMNSMSLGIAESSTDPPTEPLAIRTYSPWAMASGQWVGGYRVRGVGLGLVLVLGPCFRVKVSDWMWPVG